MDDGDRQRHGEGRALALAGALGPDAAAVHLDELLDDGEPQAQAAVPPRRAGVGLAEAVEDVREELGLDAHAGVDDADLDVRVDPLQEHLHLAALGRELHGVGEQVPDDLLEPGEVAGDGAGERIEHLVDADALGVGRRHDGGEGGLDDLGELQPLDVEAEVAGDDAGDVEQVLDELGLDLGVPLDGREPFLQVLGVDLAGAEDLGPAEDGVERRAQLVR